MSLRAEGTLSDSILRLNFLTMVYLAVRLNVSWLLQNNLNTRAGICSYIARLVQIGLEAVQKGLESQPELDIIP